jgi:hypothetical protein
MKKITALFVVGILVGVLVGCATTSNSYETKEIAALEVASVLKFSDIPIPNGFNLLPSESFAFQNNELRITLLKYIGKGTIDRISSFYKEQMPLYKWDMINIVEYGSNVMNFQRETEICTITIIPQGSKSQLVISVTPRASLASLSSGKTIVK